MKSLSCVWLFVNPWTVAFQAHSVHGIFHARVLECIAISFSRGSSRPRNRTRVSHIAGRHFTVWATRDDLKWYLKIIKALEIQWGSVQFSSVTQSCPTLCDSVNRSTTGLPDHHQLPEFTQTHVYQVGDTIQPSHPLPCPSPPAINLSQDQGLFQWISFSH